MKMITTTIAILFLAIFSNIAASQSWMEKEIKSYQEIMSSGTASMIKKAESELSWSGISDTSIYDKAEERLLKEYKETSNNSLELNSWLAKILSISGNPKYKDTLNNLLNNNPPKKLKKHIKLSLDRFDRYEKWNPIISSGTKNLNQENTTKQRINNMLNSQIPELIRIGTKRIYYAHTDNQQLLDNAKNRLMNDYQSSSLSKNHIDALAWICKTLAESGKKQYKIILNEVAKNSSESKLKKYAKKYAKNL